MTEQKKAAYVIDANWLEGVRAAAMYAHNNYDEPNVDDIIDAAVAAKVREQADL